MPLNATLHSTYQDHLHVSCHDSLFLRRYFKLLQLVRCLLHDSADIQVIF